MYILAFVSDNEDYVTANCTGTQEYALRGVHTAYDVVRRRTTSYVQKCAEIEHVSISAFRSRRKASYDVARSVNAVDTLHVFD